MDFDKKCKNYVRCKTRDEANVIENKEIRYGTKNKVSSSLPTSLSALKWG